MTGRRFLFLQGNSSPFFLKLGEELKRRGHGVARINICGGDERFWRGLAATSYRGRSEDFGAFVADIVAVSAVTDVILHNDCRPAHRSAIAAARDAGCRIWVFEEGYLRPHWLTLEEGGINGFSSFPRDPELLLTGQSADSGEGVPHTPLRSAMRERVLYDFEWQLWNYVLRFRYPHYRTHRPYPIWAEYATWTRRLAALPWRKRRATTILRRLIESGASYFAFPMQLDSDSQVREHSPFADMTEALECVISSFASSAPADSLLVVKAHPLDNGWINFRRRTEKIARTFGVAARVVYIDGGDWNVLARGARGAVTLNSTAGLTALESGKPVICLGKAIYDIPGLTYRGSLDAFWTDPYRPDQRLMLAFKRHLARRCMINGNYYTPEGIALAVANAVSRFEEVVESDTVAAADRRSVGMSEGGTGQGKTSPPSMVSRGRVAAEAFRPSVR